MDYDGYSLAVVILFQCTEQTLGVQFQFLDQSKHRGLGLHLYASKRLRNNWAEPE